MAPPVCAAEGPGRRASRPLTRVRLPMSTAKLTFEGKDYEFPVVEGTEQEKGLVIADLRKNTGLITLDPGYGNTGSCKSSICFIDGEKGILRYRGYPIEQVAERARFTEVCYLLIYGKRPTVEELKEFRDKMNRHTLLHEDMKKFYEGYPPGAHPMAIMAAMFSSLSTFYPETEQTLDLNIVRLLAKSKTIAAFAHKKSIGQPFVYPRNDLSWPGNFLRMMFAELVLFGERDEAVDERVVDALVNIDALDAATRLPAVEERAVDEVLHRVLELHVRANVRRITELEPHPDEALRREPLHR